MTSRIAGTGEWVRSLTSANFSGSSRSNDQAKTDRIGMNVLPTIAGRLQNRNEPTMRTVRTGMFVDQRREELEEGPARDRRRPSLPLFAATTKSKPTTRKNRTAPRAMKTTSQISAPNMIDQLAAAVHRALELTGQVDRPPVPHHERHHDEDRRDRRAEVADVGADPGLVADDVGRGPAAELGVERVEVAPGSRRCCRRAGRRTRRTCRSSR